MAQGIGKEPHLDMSGLDILLLQNAHKKNGLTRRESSDDRKIMNESSEFLSHELRRLYGATGEDKLIITANNPPFSSYLLKPLQDKHDDFPNKTVIGDVLRDREAEFQIRQEHYSHKLRGLNEERKRLLDVQNQLKKTESHEKKPSVPYIISSNDTPDWTFTFKSLPPPKPVPPSTVSAQSVEAVINDIRRNYPKEKEQYYFMRRNHEAELRRLEKLHAPYRGELGISSYKKSQMEIYKLVRSLVEDEIDRFLDCLFKPKIHAYSENTRKALLLAEKKENEKYRNALLHDNLSQLISENLLFDVTRQITVEAVKQFFYICAISKNISDKVLMNTAEIIATGNDDGRDMEEPTYSTVTRLYFGTQADRKEKRTDLWRHTQYIHLIGQETGDQIEPDEQDVDYIEFNEIMPTELKSTSKHSLDSVEERDNKVIWQRYRNYEINYWNNITAKLFTISVHKQGRGICSVRASHNHKFVAVGTFHGDVIIYDVRVFPWKALRAVYNTNTKVEDPVIDICWSLDGSQLITINMLGTLNLWSFNAGSVSKDDLKGLGLRQADTGGFYTPQLIRQLEMDVDEGDFLFASGPMELMGVHDSKFGPVTACFHPSITLFGTQRCMCVALENGDILKCDVESRLHNDAGSYVEPTRVYQANVRPGIPSYIGANVEAEMFRQHNHPIIFVGFINHITDMITVDSYGYINIWKYNKKYVNQYNWFKPFRRLRIRQYKIMFAPVGSTKPNVIFTDKKRNLSRQKLGELRKLAEKAFADSRLQHPWHTEVLKDQKLISRIYKPDGSVSEAGGLFHIVWRHLDTDQISTYLTRFYQPVKVKVSRFFGVKQSPCGRELVILKLYPAHVPKAAHFTVLRFDLSTLEMVDFRKDIFLTEQEYDTYIQQEVVHWDITKVYGPTGSDYLFLNRSAVLEAFSLNTGQKVLKLIDPKRKIPDPFIGCKINDKTMKLSPNTRVLCVGTRGIFYVGFYEKLQDSLRVLQLQDQNNDQERRAMWKVFSSIPNYRHVAKELRVNVEDFYLEDIQHPRVYARNIVLEAMDKALAKKSRLFSKSSQVSDTIIAEDQVNNYRSLHGQVPQLVSDAMDVRGRGDDLLLVTPETPLPTRASLVEITPEPSTRSSLLVPGAQASGSYVRRASLQPSDADRRGSLRQSLPRPSGERDLKRPSAAPSEQSSGLDGARRPSLDRKSRVSLAPRPEHLGQEAPERRQSPAPSRHDDTYPAVTPKEAEQKPVAGPSSTSQQSKSQTSDKPAARGGKSDKQGTSGGKSDKQGTSGGKSSKQETSGGKSDKQGTSGGKSSKQDRGR